MNVTESSPDQPTFRAITERRITSRVSWSAIFVGTAVSIGVWLMLHMLSLGIGLTAIDPDDAGTLQGVGIGAGVGSLVAPILALFVGGIVTGRVAGVFDRPLGAIHGSVVWALTTVAGVTLLVMGLSAAIGTTTRVAGEAVQSAAGLVAVGASGMDSKDGKNVMNALGLSSEEMVAPLNRELQAQGKPAVTVDQLQAATKDVIGDAVRRGQLDREMLIQSIVNHTAITRAQAVDLAGQIEQRWNAAKQQLAEAAESAKTAALQAAESTGKGMLIVFAAMLFSLIAAGGGAMVGSTWSRKQLHYLPVR